MSVAKVRLLAAASGSVLMILALVPLTALAGEGNGNYLGILSSTAPSGYIPSPSSYTTPATLSFQFDVTNLTNEQQSMTLGLSVDHIITYNGQDVSDGQPGVGLGDGPVTTVVHPRTRIAKPMSPFWDSSPVFATSTWK